MTDTTFTSSYITTDAIFEAWIGSDPRAAAIALKAAAAATQEWYLQKATKVIDSLEFQGVKYVSDQARQFPRKYLISDLVSPWGSIVNADTYGYTSDGLVPSDITDACCEEAIALYSYYSSTDTDISERQSLQDQGVKSYSLGGGYSETFDLSARTSRLGLQSSEAYALLSKYIDRNFRTV